MWFLNLPTGLLLIALSPFLPESARFLMHMGRTAEAQAILARFGAVKPIRGAGGGRRFARADPAGRAALSGIDRRG